MDHFGNEKNESTSTLEMVRWQQERTMKFSQPIRILSYYE